MLTLVERKPMAKKAGRPKLGKDEVTVKLARDLADQARLIATHRKMSVGALLSELLREPMARAYSQMLKALEAKRPT
jgi:hypothetical protein